MKSRDIFLLAIKITGLIVLLQGLRNLFECLILLLGFATAHLSTPRYWAAWGFIKIVAGYYLMVGLTPFLDLAFPLKREPAAGAPLPIANPGDHPATNRPQTQLEPKAVFDLIVKTAGLIVLLYGLEYLADSLMYAMQSPASGDTSKHSWLVFSMLEVVAGLLLMRGTVPLADFAFPGKASPDQPKAGAAGTREESHGS